MRDEATILTLALKIVPVAEAAAWFHHDPIRELGVRRQPSSPRWVIPPGSSGFCSRFCAANATETDGYRRPCAPAGSSQQRWLNMCYLHSFLEGPKLPHN
jgi:hypothetical protein